jgi:hypothetical protein
MRYLAAFAHILLEVKSQEGSVHLPAIIRQSNDWFTYRREKQ